LANHRQEHEEALVSRVGGLDMHRKQITFDDLDTMTGALRRGKITPADRPTLREWLGRLADYPESVRLVVEGCTGWRYVVEECRQAGSTSTWPSRPTPPRLAVPTARQDRQAGCEASA